MHDIRAAGVCVFIRSSSGSFTLNGYRHYTDGVERIYLTKNLEPRLRRQSLVLQAEIGPPYTEGVTDLNMYHDGGVLPKCTLPLKDGIGILLWENDILSKYGSGPMKRKSFLRKDIMN